MNYTFAEWMRAIDREIHARVGLCAMDLPDVPYMDMYDDGVSPEEAALATIAYANGDEDLP